MTDQKSNERDGQPEAVQSPEITTDFSSLELETLDTAEEEGKRLIRHYVQLRETASSRTSSSLGQT